MFKPPLLLQPHSGLVPFSGAAEPVPGDRATQASTDDAQWARNAPPPVGTWEAPAGVGVRRVEIAIIACVCGNFTFALGRLLGLY